MGTAAGAAASTIHRVCGSGRPRAVRGHGYAILAMIPARWATSMMDTVIGWMRRDHVNTRERLSLCSSRRGSILMISSSRAAAHSKI